MRNITGKIEVLFKTIMANLFVSLVIIFSIKSSLGLV